MFKKIILSAAILWGLIVAILLWRQYTPKEEGPKTTGLPMKVARYNWPGMYWVEIAHKKGWFKETGLNVQLIDTNPDYYGSLDSMVDGKMDVNGYYFFDLINYRLKGADLIAVINQDNSFGVDAIVAKKGIETIRDLKGKTIGLTKETYLEYLLSISLARTALTLHDVTIVDMPGEKTVEEFIKGNVDAIVTWEPFVTEAINKGSGRRLFDTSEIPGIMPGVCAFHKSFIEKRPEDIQAYVNVWHKTTRFIKENPKEAFGIIADIYNVAPGEVQALTQADKILDLRDNLTAFSYGTGFESLHGTARQINNFMINKGMTDKQLDSTEFLDVRFIRTLKR
jgi:NitT/TauT family transport system substrate-binding protein